MKLKPFAELIAMSKEKFDEAMAPIRARKVRSQADLEIAKLDEKLISLETKIHELCATKDINFSKVIDLMDEHALVERRKGQLDQIVKDLFPS